jgi:hypothetical protein
VHDRVQATTHSGLPLECHCAAPREHLQRPFAEQALDVLPHRKDLAYEAHGDGLVIYAETEFALDRPLRVLHEIYGASLRIEPAAIRYRVNDVIEEPHMAVRVLCAARHFASLKQDFLARGASILDEELRPPVGVIRATAPLRKLIGYSQWLAQHTSGSAREVMWLAHYAPCEHPQPDAVSG